MGGAQANELAEQLVAEVADAEDLCLSYQEVLVFVGVSKQHAEKLGVTRQQVNRCACESACSCCRGSCSAIGCVALAQFLLMLAPRFLLVVVC